MDFGYAAPRFRHFILLEIGFFGGKLSLISLNNNLVISRKLQVSWARHLYVAHIKIKLIIPIRLARIKKKKITSVGEEAEKGEHLCSAGGNALWCGHCAKQCGGASKN